MLKITTEQKTKGIEIGRKLGQSKMWVNYKGEYFTNENFANISVGNDKEKVGMIEVTSEAITEKKTNELGKVEDVIVAIEAAAEVDVVQAIIDAENEGKKRKSVLEAGAKKIETLNASK